MTTVLVANRGEIALRIFRTAKRMGMRTVAVFSDADAGAPYARFADVRVRIGPAPATESYLRRDRMIAAARETGADLIHPGYGFLAEDDRFAKDCEDGGITFVGPPSDVLAGVGDKASARRLAELAGVPVLPAYAGDDQRDEAFVGAAERVGFPLIVKPSGGGGGKGMSVVREPGGLIESLASARRLASAAFDDDRLILERYLEHPRHIEVQILADRHGNVVHLGERDCSLQRRHQKVLEESPAPDLETAVRARIHGGAVDFARAAGYVGAGTCEFLVGPAGDVGFIEMNARLQVEHPVTEAVTGLDLVELQLRIAMNERLPMAQDDVHANGHAIEVRVYAEAPEDGFLPQAGRIEHMRWPDGVRTDAGVEEGSDVPPYYDPLLAKIVVHGADRPAALDELHRSLGRAQVLGVRTNLTFLAAVARDPVVVGARVATDWLDHAVIPTAPSNEVAAALAAAAQTELLLATRASSDPWSGLGPWRPGGTGATRVVLRPGGQERVFVVEGTGPFVVDGVRAGRGRRCHEWWTTGDEDAAAVRRHDTWFVWVGGAAHEIPVGVAPRRLAGAGPAHLDSPLPGQVIAIHVSPGQRVAEGDELVVVEAMKMEHAIRSPADGTVRAVLCATGDQVGRGQALVDFEAE
jgi:acetyl/propionyl-CoA carboxylase alpha subunit